jgi:hypothetical protein
MSAQIVEERVQTGARVQDTVTVAAGRHVRPGRPRIWQRLRGAVAEMNYASRRMVEVQAPWITGDQQR